MVRYLIAASIVTLVTIGAYAQAGAPDLDTRFIPRPSSADAGTRSTQTSRPVVYESPITVRLVRLEPASCSWDDLVTYDVELRNDGKRAIALPWSAFPTDSPQADESPTVFPFVGLSLAVGQNLEGRLGSWELLYGDRREPGSFRRLAPGASVTIRAATLCQLEGRAGRLIAPGGEMAVKVFVRVNVKRSSDELGAFTTSNGLPLTISR